MRIVLILNIMCIFFLVFCMALLSELNNVWGFKEQQTAFLLNPTIKGVYSLTYLLGADCA